MAGKFVSERDPIVYEKLREAFVTRLQKPTLTDLSTEFDVPISTVSRIAADESWTTLRAGHLAKKEREGDAISLVVRAAERVDQAVMNAFSDVALAGLRMLALAIGRIPEDQAASTQVQTVNSASFAFKNFADGCKAVGIVSFSKELDSLGKEANGRWNPEMLQQINVTVQNLTAQQAKDQPVIPVTVAKADPPGDLPKKAE